MKEITRYSCQEIGSLSAIPSQTNTWVILIFWIQAGLLLENEGMRAV